MTKTAKNKEMPPLDDETEAQGPNETADNGPEGTSKRSLFKSRPGDDDFDPLDLANHPADMEQEDLDPSAIADQGDEDSTGPWDWYHPDGLTIEDVDRQDRAFGQVAMGKPRSVQLSTGPFTVMRLTDPLTPDAMQIGAGGDHAEYKDRLRLKLAADQPVKLEGPATEHAIDEVTSALYTGAPMFAPFLQAMRESASLSLAHGARYFHFRPTIIVSPPGLGKTTLAQNLASATGLPLIYLDGSTMMTTVDLSGGDAVFRTSRPSVLFSGIIQHGVGNPLVVFNEVDKIADVSKGGRENPAEALLPFLERQTAGRIREHFMQIDLDLRFLNWLLLANDLDKIPRTVRDRCKVIQIPPLMPRDLAAIAEAEVLRRHLELELIPELTRACARGQIKSLRKLHKTLDAAEATLRRPRLH